MEEEELSDADLAKMSDETSSHITIVKYLHLDKIQSLRLLSAICEYSSICRRYITDDAKYLLDPKCVIDVSNVEESEMYMKFISSLTPKGIDCATYYNECKRHENNREILKHFLDFCVNISSNSKCKINVFNTLILDMKQLFGTYIDDDYILSRLICILHNIASNDKFYRNIIYEKGYVQIVISCIMYNRNVIINGFHFLELFARCSKSRNIIKEYKISEIYKNSNYRSKRLDKLLLLQ